MDFIKPYFLWSALAIIIPILIHFWHQKKGKVIVWAAMQWLTEKNQQQNRGLQLDNVPLLIVRCLALLVLAVLLSQPIWNDLFQSTTSQRIHLIQPDAFLTSNFRFELEDALKKGEKLYWISPKTEAVESLAQLPAVSAVSPLLIQASVNQVAQRLTNPKLTELHLYVINSQQLAAVPGIYIPTAFSLHTAKKTDQPQAAFLATNGKNVFVDQSNNLVSRPALDPSQRFRSTPAHNGPISVMLTYRNKAEQQTVAAALNALSDIYDILLSIDVTASPAKVYDWVLTDRLVSKPAPKTLYTVSGHVEPTTAPNVCYTPATLLPQTSELVQNGQLPEWLGEQLIGHFGLKTETSSLSPTELATLFKKLKPGDGHQQAHMQPWLLLFFVVLIGIERWMALTKNA